MGLPVSADAMATSLLGEDDPTPAVDGEGVLFEEDDDEDEDAAEEEEGEVVVEAVEAGISSDGLAPPPDLESLRFFPTTLVVVIVNSVGVTFVANKRSLVMAMLAEGGINWLVGQQRRRWQQQMKMAFSGGGCFSVVGAGGCCEACGTNPRYGCVYRRRSLAAARSYRVVF